MNNSLQPSFNLLESQDFVHDLNSELNSLPTHVCLTSFGISSQSIMNLLKPNLLRILKNSGVVEIHGDAVFSKYNFTDKVWLFLNNQETRVRNNNIRIETQKMYAELREAGAQIEFNEEPTNWFKQYVLPVYKSDHRKLIVLTRSNGTKVAYIGGTNLTTPDKNDFMVKIIGEEITDPLYSISKYFGNNLPQNDIEISLSQGKVLFDRGNFLRSLILDNAKSMIEAAQKSIVYVTQLPPESFILKLLIKAEQRGVKVTIILPNKEHSNLTSFPYNLAFSFSKLLLKLSKSNIRFNHLNKYTHSKILVCDDEVLIGSHNLSTMGVVSSIKEASLRIENQQLLDQVTQFIDNLRI